MSADIRAKFEQQLPKGTRFSFENLFNYVAGLASIGGLIGAPFVISDPSSLSFVYLTFLTLLVVVLMVYAYLVDRRKLHRYAQSVIFLHYVNHIIRDALQDVENIEINEITEKALNAVATCFSIITAKHCRASVVELTKNFELKVLARDDISKVGVRKRCTSHCLDENTDFHDLWYAQNGCARYFLSNDLKKRWKQHRYKTSSFKEVGQPYVQSFFGVDVIRNWRLPYRSALVLPIRYISSFRPPEKQETEIPHWKYWGFLCIDCNTSRCFDHRYCPELAGAFADELYTFFSQSEYLLDVITRPTP